MIKSPLVHLAHLCALLLIPFAPQRQLTTLQQIEALKSASALLCTPDRAALTLLLDDEKQIPLMPGSGSYVWKINTNDSAQLFFNQGVNTYYGFHIIESLASFKKAAALDPENPMVWWAQALAYGPNINDVGYSASPEALSAVQKAMRLIDKANPVEKALIHAMQVRYSDDTTQTREMLNQAYVDAMKQVYDQHPNSADVLALYADAMMLQHPWDLWEVSGTPRPWTPLIQKVLEQGLALAPAHPGLNHYYIHVIEPSPQPEKAMASAGILGSITPGLAHLVHMPSHIYLRTGQFNKGAAINRDALNQFNKYAELFPAVTGGAFIYQLHNQHMLANCAMHAGKYKTAIAAALELQQSIDSATINLPPPMGSLIQYLYMAPVLINTRFEKWDSLLNMQKPDDRYVYANLLYEFGRGMANTGKNNTAEARKNVARIEELMQNADLKIEMTPFSAAIEGAITARELLVGSIHLKENQYDKAINHLTKAAQTEEKMVYNEPRDWFLNPHQYLGTAYMQSKDYRKAEEVFRKDLKMNANNVWSLNRLQQALVMQKKKKEAALAKKSFQASAGEADVEFASFYY